MLPSTFPSSCDCRKYGGKNRGKSSHPGNAGLSVDEAGKLLHLLASLERIGAENVLELRQTLGTFVVPQLKWKLASLHGKSFQSRMSSQ